MLRLCPGLDLSGAGDLPRSLRFVHKCTKLETSERNAFIRRIKRLGRVRGVPVRRETRYGKGRHGRLYYGERFTTVKDRKKEIGKGLLMAMLRQLGIAPDELD